MVKASSRKNGPSLCAQDPAKRVLDQQIVRIDLAPEWDHARLAVGVRRIAVEHFLVVVAPEVGGIVGVRHPLAQITVVVIEPEIQRAAVVFGHP